MTNVSQQLVSGTLSGFTTTILLQPLDLLKTRAQQRNCASGSHLTTIETAKTVLARDGPKGLWRGTGASLARNMPGVALYMTSVTQLRALMARSPYFVKTRPVNDTTSVLPVLTGQGNLIAGASARVAIGFLLNPLSILKARYESTTYRYSSFTQAFTSIIRQGPSEVLRGFVASSLRDAPHAGLFMIFYEAIKRDAVPITTILGNTPTTIHLFSAAAAGAIATIITHPFDVVKTNMQVRPESHYHKLDTTVKAIWKSRGIVGYFDGLSLRMSRKVFSSAISWTIYEGLLLFIHTSAGKPQ